MLAVLTAAPSTMRTGLGLRDEAGRFSHGRDKGEKVTLFLRMTRQAPAALARQRQLGRDRSQRAACWIRCAQSASGAEDRWHGSPPIHPRRLAKTWREAHRGSPMVACRR